MKAILSAALVFGPCGRAQAQDKADPVGTWKCEDEIGGQKRESTPTVEKDGDKFAGTMAWPDTKEAELADVTVKGGELTFSAEREVVDNKCTVEYKLKVEGDKIGGTGSVDAGGEKRDFDIAGQREKAKDK